MNSGGNFRGGDDDDDDFGRGRRDRNRGPRRGGRREFAGDMPPDYGGPMPEMGDAYGGDSGRGDRGRGDRGRGDRDGHGHGHGHGQGGGFRGGEGRPHAQEREQKPAGPRQNGVLKFFNSERGFGFITPDDGNKDIFVHISAIERSGLPQLEEGTRISFETEEDRRGRGSQAVNLQLIDE